MSIPLYKTGDIVSVYKNMWTPLINVDGQIGIVIKILIQSSGSIKYLVLYGDKKVWLWESWVGLVS